MNDLMIDIETLGTAPGSVILSIGAVKFDAETGQFGDEFYLAIDPQTSVAHGLTIDVSTIKWWNEQSEEARSAAFGGTNIITMALLALADFVKSSGAIRIWAKPASFDIVLLESAFRACFIDIPWHYRTQRDVRTVLDLAGVTQPTVGTVHNALDDAKSQALGVVEAYRVLASRKVAPDLLDALKHGAAAIGDWSRPTSANGMVPARLDHPLMVAQNAMYDAIAKAEGRS